jgi:hypothetical protein
MAKIKSTRRTTRGTGRLTLDEALIALFIGATNANDHAREMTLLALTT